MKNRNPSLILIGAIGVLVAVAAFFLFFFGKEKGGSTSSFSGVFPAAFVPIWFAAAKKKKGKESIQRNILILLVGLLVAGLGLSLVFLLK